MNHVFTLTDEQNKRLEKFVTDQNILAIRQQKDRITLDDPFYLMYKDHWDDGYAYGGAVGGVITYSFTPTSLGTDLVIRHNLTSNTINLTEYNNW
jgi:hypothetical protein